MINDDDNGGNGGGVGNGLELGRECGDDSIGHSKHDNDRRFVLLFSLFDDRLLPLFFRLLLFGERFR